MKAIFTIPIVEKMLEACGCNTNNAIYALVHTSNTESKNLKTLHKQINVVNSAIEILTTNKTNAKKNSEEYKLIKKEKDRIFTEFGNLKSSQESTIGINPIKAMVAVMTEIYLESFFDPIQFFVPNASPCSGQWELWDDIDYFNLKKQITEKDSAFKFKTKMLSNDIWNYKFKPEDFPLIIKRRLQHEKEFGKKLNPESLIKALIIRMGKLAKPDVNYEVIDYAIRSLFTDLKVKKYLRVDREMEFLKRLETEIKKTLRKF